MKNGHGNSWKSCTRLSPLWPGKNIMKNEPKIKKKHTWSTWIGPESPSVFPKSVQNPPNHSDHFETSDNSSSRLLWGHILLICNSSYRNVWLYPKFYLALMLNRHLIVLKCQLDKRNTLFSSVLQYSWKRTQYSWKRSGTRYRYDIDDGRPK